MGFVVIRHAETGGIGTCPLAALDHFAARGWERISDERAEPDEFYLPDFAEPSAQEQPQTPAEPAEDEEQ